MKYRFVSIWVIYTRIHSWSTFPFGKMMVNHGSSVCYLIYVASPCLITEAVYVYMFSTVQPWNPCKQFCYHMFLQVSLSFPTLCPKTIYLTFPLFSVFLSPHRLFPVLASLDPACLPKKSIRWLKRHLPIYPPCQFLWAISTFALSPSTAFPSRLVVYRCVCPCPVPLPLTKPHMLDWFCHHKIPNKIQFEWAGYLGSSSVASSADIRFPWNR